MHLGCAFLWTLISQTSVHVCGCELATSPKFAVDPATRSKTYLCQPYLKSVFYPLCWLLLWYFSVSHSFFPSLLPPLFPPSPVSRISSIIHAPPPYTHTHTPFSAFPLSLSPSPFLLLAPYFDSGCASLGAEDRAPQTLEGYWSCMNTGLHLSMRLHCERGLIVRVRPQRERTKGHGGSLWHTNMKGAPHFNED